MIICPHMDNGLLSEIAFVMICKMIVMVIIIFISMWNNYCQTSNISRTFAGNKLVDHSDVVRALPFGTASSTSSFST